MSQYEELTTTMTDQQYLVEAVTEMRYVRPLASFLKDSTPMPSFLRERAGEKASHRMRLPRCAFIISFNVAPPGRFSSSRIFSVLVPCRAAPTLGLSAAFRVGPALRAGLAFCGATAGRGCARKDASKHSTKEARRVVAPLRPVIGVVMFVFLLLRQSPRSCHSSLRVAANASQFCFLGWRRTTDEKGSCRRRASVSKSRHWRSQRGSLTILRSSLSVMDSSPGMRGGSPRMCS